MAQKLSTLIFVNFIEATDLTVHGTRGIAAGPVTFHAPPRRPVALLGPAGSGKSTLLLALAGRMHGTRGKLTVAGVDGIARHQKDLRKIATVARIAGWIDIENTLSIEDSLTERTLFDGARPKDRHTRFLQAAETLGLAPGGKLPFAWTALVDELTPLQRTQLCVALTCVRPAQVVVIDDVESELSLDDQRLLWQGFARLSADGPVVIAGTREPAAFPLGVTTVDLGPGPTQVEPHHALETDDALADDRDDDTLILPRPRHALPKDPA